MPLRAATFMLAGLAAAGLIGVPGRIAAASAQKPDAAPVADTKAIDDDPEVRLGRENAAQNDKQVKLVTDAAIVDRVNRIGQAIAAIADTMEVPALWGNPKVKPFHYTFKVVDDKDPNAYSLPGGFVYINKGLIDYVHSDDELAGVIAHEITHAAHHHMMKLLSEQKKINNVLLPAIIAGAALGRGNLEATGQLLIAGNLFTVAKLNSYGVDAERDADHGAILYLQHTKYNPVGLYSFMLRLAADAKNNEHGELGIFRTHPPSDERARAARELLNQLHIPILLSEVDPALRAQVSPWRDENTGAELARVTMQGVVMCDLAADGDETADARATRVAKALTSFADNHLQPFEIHMDRAQTRVIARGVTILTQADAAAQGRKLPDLMSSLSAAVTEVCQKQQMAALPGVGGD